MPKVLYNRVEGIREAFSLQAVGGPRLEREGLRASHHCWRVSLRAPVDVPRYSWLNPELGINFSHIRAKSLAVLNPLRHVDEHIMDDADLAGPLLFVFCFGTFLLFVREHD